MNSRHKNQLTCIVNSYYIFIFPSFNEIEHLLLHSISILVFLSHFPSSFFLCLGRRSCLNLVHHSKQARKQTKMYKNLSRFEKVDF